MEIRKVSSGFWPKPSPRSSPSTRMNNSGVPPSSPAASRSRRSSRSSFLASVQTTFIPRPPESVPQGPPGQVQEDPLEVRLLHLQVEQLDLALAQHGHQPE